jgi:signal transduction histidine kinase
MAKTMRLPSLTHSTWALSIVDDDPLGHADWRLKRENYVDVTPSERIIVEWDEVYNFGACAQTTRLYPCPPAGVYKFRVDVEDATGAPLEERVYTVNIVLPYWEKPWFIVLASLALIALLFVIVRMFVQIRMRRIIRKMESEHMLERERFRIARNIHDNLGARLTHITLVSGRSEFEDLTSDDFRRSVHKISEMTRDLVSSLYETVWAIDPENDHLDSLVTHLVQMTENLSEAAGLQCRVNAPDLIEAHTLSSGTRHAVSLTVKEAIHNAIKHSNATEISITIGVRPSELSVEIHDNGQGFAMQSVRQGSGLRNMRTRMAEIAATIDIQGNEGSGTTVILRVPIVGRNAKK